MSKIIATDRDPGDFLHWLSTMHFMARTRHTNWSKSPKLDDERDVAVMDVPCGECHECCTGGYSVQVREWEFDKETCESYEHANGTRQLRLKQKEDGSCIHWEGECTIYETRPEACGYYDCRDQLATGIADRQVENAIKSWDFGKWQVNRENKLFLTALRLAATAAYDTTPELHKDNAAIREQALATFPQYLAHAMKAMVEIENWDGSTVAANELLKNCLDGKVSDLAFVAIMAGHKPEIMHGYRWTTDLKALGNCVDVLLRDIAKEMKAGGPQTTRQEKVAGIKNKYGKGRGGSPKGRNVH